MEFTTEKIGHQNISEQDKKAIFEQLSRMLDSAFFRHSKRLPSLLQFVIERTLSGDVEEIKERTLGVEIFGRKPDYETATDPIVRVTAAEVRKRLAQYYSERGHENELRIALRSGSYVPSFDWPDATRAVRLQEKENLQNPSLARSIVAPAEEMIDFEETRASEPPMDEPELNERLAATRQSPNDTVHIRRATVIMGVAGVLLVVATVVALRAIRYSPIDFFWGPVLAARERVLICVADQLQDSGIALRDAADPSHTRWFNDTPKRNAFRTVALDDVNVVANTLEVLHSQRKQYTLKGEADTSLSDLRSGPAIFVGAFDNVWTLRMTNSLRYHFANDPGMNLPRIVDSANPTKTSWATNQSQVAEVGTYRDYAIVARFTDSNTGRPAVVVAGIGRCASLVAGQFVSDEDELSSLERAARSAGNKKNMEVVLSMQVVDGQAGSPKIEAIYFW